jgi:hypothetical protein
MFWQCRAMLGYDDPEYGEWMGKRGHMESDRQKQEIIGKARQQPQAEVASQQASDSDVNGSPKQPDRAPWLPAYAGEVAEQRHYFGPLASKCYHKEEFKFLDVIFQGCFAARILLLLVATGCVIAMMFFINVPNCDRNWYADEEQWCYMYPGWKKEMLSANVSAAEFDSRADLKVEYPLLVLQAGRTNACSGLKLMEAMPRVPQQSCRAGNLLGVFVWEFTEAGRIVRGILFSLTFIVLPCATKSRSLQVAREHFRLEHCSLWPFNAESLGLLFTTISHSLALNLLYLPFTSISLVSGAQDWFVLRSYEMLPTRESESISNPLDGLLQDMSWGLLRFSFLLILVTTMTVPKSFQRTFTEISIPRYMRRQGWSIFVLSISLYSMISMLTKMGISCALGINITLVFTFDFSIGIVGCAAVLRFALMCDTFLCFSMLVMSLCAVKVPELGGLTNLRGPQSRTPVGLWIEQSRDFGNFQIIQSKSDIEYNDGTVIPQGSLGKMYFCVADMDVVRQGRELYKRSCCSSNHTEFEQGWSMRVDWRNGIKKAQVLPKLIDQVTVRGLLQCPLCNPHVECEGLPDSQCDIEKVDCVECNGWFWALTPERADA